jgi:hypothetical protein
MRTLLALTAASEGVTGLAMAIAPLLVVLLRPRGHVRAPTTGAIP